MYNTDYKYAVNVKSYAPYSDNASTLADLDPQLLENTIGEYQMAFWEDADEHAKAFGFDGVWQEGRYGGWCVPYYNTGTRKLTTSQIIGDGCDDEEYNSYEQNFEMFKIEIDRLKANFEQEFESEVKSLIAEYFTELECKQNAAIVLGYN